MPAPNRPAAPPLVVLICALLLTAAQAADDALQVDYTRDIKPLLHKHCAKCHGAEKQEAGLRLDTAAGAIAGGDSGAAVTAGKAAESLLIRAVVGQDDEVTPMPPEGARLTDDEIALLRRWIELGAPAPQEEAARPAGFDHWSFQPPLRVAPPPTNDTAWAKNAIDQFILARLEAQGIVPAPEADRATLIRRLSFDLRGLPPSPQELEQFLADESPEAYERLVERLLASPAYGERWGRHWLDLARYADSNGYTRDFAREIWKYRDWVIAAVNRDQPFDEFAIEQFAGDLLPNPTLDQLVATGFHRNTLINEEGGTDAEQFRVDAVADRVNTTGVVFLGLTLGCARCHAHKYDPISHREYYQLFAFLNQCDEPTIDAPSDLQVARGVVARRDEIRRQVAEMEKQLKDQQEEFAAKQAEWEATITPEQRAKLAGPTQAALDVDLDKRTDEQKKLVADLYKTTDHARAAFPLLEEVARLRKSAPTIPTTMILRPRSEPRETFVHLRGDFLDRGAKVEAAAPAVLHELRTDDGAAPDRLDFARWLVDANNPLTPRVIVNRWWQQFFGRGIVETENDFGLQGEPPTHPQLLDWLALEFVDQQWSAKAIHRLIVTSAAYRQSSHYRPELADVDPNNKLFARQSRLRLEAEIIRDAALAASSLLTCDIGGPSVHPPQPDGVFQFTQDPKPWNADAGGDRYRRGMYTYLWRSSPYPAMTVFDFPEANVTCTRRARSNTPLQALTLANDLAFFECAQALAERVVRAEPHDQQQRAELAFRLCLGRAPNPQEAELFQRIVAAQTADVAGGKAEQTADAAMRDDLIAWTAACRVLLNLDEFVTRE